MNLPVRSPDPLLSAGAPTDRGWTWAVALILLCVAFAAPVIFAGRMYFIQACGDADLPDFYLPMRTLLADRLSKGTLPFWTRGIYGGLPALSEIEVGALHPLNWAGPWAHPGRSLSMTLFLTLLVAGLGSFRLARSLGMSGRAAFVTGATWPLSGQFLSNFVTPSGLVAVCTMPLALSVVVTACREDRPRGLIWLAPLLALSLFGGYPIMTYLTGWAVALYLGFTWLVREEGDRRLRWAHLGWLVAAGLIAALLAAPQLLPTIEYLSQSDRASALTPQSAATCSLHPKWLLQWIHPWILGDVSVLGTPFPEDGYFPWTNSGPLAVMALLLLVVRPLSDRPMLRWLGILAATVAFSLGRYNPLFPLLLHLPGASFFRNPSRALFLSELALALMAGWLCDRVARAAVQESPEAGAAAARALHQGPLWLAARRPGRATIATALAVVQVAWLALIGLPVLPTIEAGSFPPPSATAQHLSRIPQARVYSLFRLEAWVAAYVRAGGWRGDQTPYLRYLSLLHPNASMLYGIPSAQGYVGLNLPRSEFFSFHLYRPGVDGTHPRTVIPAAFAHAMRRLGVTHVTSIRPLEGAGLTEVHRTRYPWDGFQVRAYAVTHPIPRVRVVDQVRRGTASPDDLKWLLDPRIDPSRTVFIEGVAPMAEGRGSPGAAGMSPTGVDDGGVDGAGTARILAETDRALVIEATALRDSHLVVADTYYPGWRAMVDGREVPIERADFVWRAVPLGPGRHIVTLSYECLPFIRGVFLMVIGAILWALCLRAGRS